MSETTHSERDYPGGYYFFNHCSLCKNPFSGPRGATVCRLCHEDIGKDFPRVQRPSDAEMLNWLEQNNGGCPDLCTGSEQPWEVISEEGKTFLGKDLREAIRAAMVAERERTP